MSHVFLYLAFGQNGGLVEIPTFPYLSLSVPLWVSVGADPGCAEDASFWDLLSEAVAAAADSKPRLPSSEPCLLGTF